ncbi:TPA: chitinase [Citrobacter braakii]|nr:chitinase [Citrobacter braakii]HEM7957383.1 chitinase [Citrobacter braakii]
MTNSKLVPNDSLSTKEYEQNGFVAATETNEFSYTSARVAKVAYNEYKPNEFKVSGYWTDWSQYDGRLDGDFAPSSCGRGVDLALLDPFAYDKITLGFCGIVGDTGEKATTINNAAVDFQRTQWQPTFVDAWGDVASYRNCGFAGWVSNDYMALFHQYDAQGVLGGLRDVQKKNPNLHLSMSIGGWTMSQAFHFMAKDPHKRALFCDGLTDLFTRFPMFSEIDLDWEYPGAPGNTGNTYDDTDAPNFAALIKDVKAALNKINRSDVKISVAAAGDIEKLKKANIPALIDAGVWGINLMTYDFFGTPWATELAHHTNLYPNGSANNWSVETAVNYLESIGVPLKQVFIGYAGYSRNAHDATIQSVSPLKGTYTPGYGTTVGTFESGSTEWYDHIANYLDLENQTGRNNFIVYTDEVADADFLYNPQSKVFMSLDTPRTVKAKAEYVKSRGLGGLFTWTADLDRGPLVNAAREGLGCEMTRQTVDMRPFYFKGITK